MWEQASQRSTKCLQANLPFSDDSVTCHLRFRRSEIPVTATQEQSAKAATTRASTPIAPHFTYFGVLSTSAVSTSADGLFAAPAAAAVAPHCRSGDSCSIRSAALFMSGKPHRFGMHFQLLLVVYAREFFLNLFGIQALGLWMPLKLSVGKILVSHNFVRFN